MTRMHMRPSALRLLVLLLAGCVGAGEQAAAPEGAGTSRGTGSDTSPTSSPDVALRVAVEQLLRGEAEGDAAPSWFSAATAGSLRSVTIDSAGHAVVDFEDLRTLIPNASSSAGSEMLLKELNAAVFSVAAVRSVDYLIEGRCELFWEWLQRGCQTVFRPATD